MLGRRGFLTTVALGGAAWIASGHAPYRQWVVYRAEHLVIVAWKKDPEAFPLTKRVAADLQITVPEARAEATRAPTLRHIASLLLSRQIDVAVLTAGQARRIAAGEGESHFEGPVPLRLLAILAAPYVVVANAGFDRGKAYLVAFGLADEQASGLIAPEMGSLTAAMGRANELRIPLHTGAREFLLGVGQTAAQDS